MYIVLVQIHVKPEMVELFKCATIENAGNSIREPGIVRFDFLQMTEEPAQFILIEVYKSPEDQLRHRETSHYNKWKESVAVMMAEPRKGSRYTNLYPDESGWSKP